MLLFASAVPSSFGLDDHNPIGVTGAFEGLITTACGYNVLNHNATRQIDDIVVPGAVGKYGLKLTRYYNSRREFGSLGPGWTHNYEWSTSTLDDKIYYPNGNVLDSSCNPPLGASDGWEDHPSNGNGTFRLADGGTIVFRNHVATSIIDPYGQTITITYAGFQIDRVTEPGGRYLQFTYRSLETQVDAYDGSGHRIDWVIYHYSPIRPARRGTQGIPVNCVTSVDYSDDTRAFYSYRDDNVPDHPGPHCPCSVKSSPLVETCQDVRYNGPMRHICYDYQDNGPHGAILAEKYSLNGSTNGARVSWIDPPAPSPIVTEPWFDTSYTEYRGDGPSRRFIYTPLHFSRVFNDDRDGCPKWNSQTGGPAPQQFLKTYTDFQGRTTWLHYDTNWYVDRVTDARGRFDGDPEHSTLYDHGPDIGEIRTITHPAPGPGGTPSSIHYDYEDPTPQTGDPHYVTRITDERGNVTKHVRDVKHRIWRTEYRDPGANDSGPLLAYETVSYCDQIDSQCSNNPLQQIKTQKLKNGAYVHYQYDPRGLLLAKTEPTWVADGPTALSTGPKTTYTYYPDGDGNKVPWSDRVKTVTLAANVSGFRASETYEYDRTFVEGVTNLNGAPVAGRGLVTKITHADGKYQQSKYDVYGNKVWEDNELRKVTTYAYDEYNRLLNVTRPLNGITNYTYNPSNGGSPYTHTTNNPDTITVRTSSTNDIVTKNVYDENFRRTSSKAAYQTPKEATTWFGYDEVGNQTYVTDPRGSGSGDARYTTYTDYDERNRKWRTREPLERTTWFEYGDNMNVTKIHRPDGTVEEKVYDGLNRLITDTVPKEPGVNIVTQLQYNPWDGDPTDSGHSGGLLQKVIDGEAHNCQFRYDAAGQKTQMIYHDGSSQQWAYDDAHNLKNRTTVHGEVQDFEYDNRNRKITEWWDGWPADGEWRAFRYDDANRLWLAANGIGAYWSGFIADVRRAYDDAGRLTLDQQTVYDARGIGTTRSINYPNYDDSGKLLRMYVNGVSPAYDYTFGYDEMGRFNKIFLTGSNNPQFEYSYDPASNETQRCNRVNNIAQNDIPDELNRMSSVEVKNTFTNTQLGLETYEYYPIGRLHTVTREDNKQDSFIYYLDGELNVASYGAAATPPPTPTPRPSATPTPTGGQVAEPIFAPAGGNIYPNSSIRVQISTSTTGAQIRYKLDENTWTTIANGGYTIYFEPGVMGKTLTAVASKLGMAESNPHSDSYWYENGRAGSGTYPLDMAGTQPAPGPMAPNVSTVTYTLDKAGNRRSVNGMSYLPNEVNQYTWAAASAVSNGDNHEINAYGGLRYVYMRDQELTQITAGNLTYDRAHDALGRCVRRIVAIAGQAPTVTYYLYDGEKPILEYRSDGTIARNLYGKGIDEILMRTDPTVNAGQPFYFQQDHEGSVTHLTNWNNGNGEIIERYRYDAFGAPTIYDRNGNVLQGSPCGNRFLFTGREYAGAWVYEYRARVYHSGIGRFMSEDPKLFDAGDYNLFRYCHNDPIDFADPMGTMEQYHETHYTSAKDSGVQYVEMMNDAYNNIMAAAQMQVSGAISAGMQGYQAWSAVSQVMAQSGNHPVNFNISLGADPRQNWNRNIHATVFSGGNDPTDNTNPAFLDRKLGANEVGAALPGGRELRGRSIDVVYPRTGARQNGIPVVDLGPHYNDTPRYPADRYWNIGARPLAESRFHNKAGLDLSPQVWRNFGFGVRYDRYGVPYPSSRFDADPVFDWRFH